ncbi:hypothetical protein HO173_004654 [Letharia columbiana]|uniref:Uncharacterized protein n=1 Tax=Letharia columbiana TaxID=112416 RepID=A0A8H6FYR5_9LECA|nr:uncharacterized protein HO173_004654 [Letharia columbiana]KAF6237186.1 hypothetical protein HO173_004654 [Letharia columbiana]
MQRVLQKSEAHTVSSEYSTAFNVGKKRSLTDEHIASFAIALREAIGRQRIHRSSSSYRCKGCRG